MEGQRRSGHGDPRDARDRQANRPDCTGDGAFKANDLPCVAGSAASRLIVGVGFRQSIRRCKSFWNSTFIEKVVGKGPGKADHSPSTPLFLLKLRNFEIACAILKNSRRLKLQKIAAAENRPNDCAHFLMQVAAHPEGRNARTKQFKVGLRSHKPLMLGVVENMFKCQPPKLKAVPHRQHIQFMVLR